MTKTGGRSYFSTFSIQAVRAINKAVVKGQIRSLLYMFTCNFGWVKVSLVSLPTQVIVVFIHRHHDEGILEVRRPSFFLLGPYLMEALPTNAPRQVSMDLESRKQTSDSSCVEGVDRAP